MRFHELIYGKSHTKDYPFDRIQHTWVDKSNPQSARKIGIQIRRVEPFAHLSVSAIS
jgi:hypothetical protein